MSNPSPTIPMDLYYDTSRPIRAYQRRDGRRTYLYQFTYAIQGVHSLVPMQITVRSVNRISATKVARYRILREVGDRYGADLASRLTVYPGHRINVRRAKPLSPEAAQKAFTKWVMPVIRNLVEGQPVYSDLFQTSTL